MSRPTKRTVDYFPHIVKGGKTLFILEKKYQNNGYAFWFKLLEELACTDGHSLNLTNDADLEFLSARTGVSEAETIEILNLLAKLDAIDKKLWKNRIIWCQKFIDNIGDVYAKRTVSVPDKPVSDNRNRSKEVKKRVSDIGNPQTKLNETKLNKYMSELDFEKFWNIYPKKEKKVDSRKKFLKLKKELLPIILEAVKAQTITKKWNFCESRFIPHPTTWLNGERWDDEIENIKLDVSERRKL